MTRSSVGRPARTIVAPLALCLALLSGISCHSRGQRISPWAPDVGAVCYAVSFDNYWQLFQPALVALHPGRRGGVVYGYRVHSYGGRPALNLRARWSSRSRDSLLISHSGGFSGIEMRLARTKRGFEGTSRVWVDAGPGGYTHTTAVPRPCVDARRVTYFAYVLVQRFYVDSESVDTSHAHAPPSLSVTGPGLLQLNGWLRTPCLSYDGYANAERLGFRIVLTITPYTNRRCVYDGVGFIYYGTSLAGLEAGTYEVAVIHTSRFPPTQDTVLAQSIAVP